MTTEDAYSLNKKMNELEEDLDRELIKKFETIDRRLEKSMIEGGKKLHYNHALLQLLLSRHLLKEGYTVYVEHDIPPLCDLVAFTKTEPTLRTKGDYLNVEIETGYSYDSFPEKFKGKFRNKIISLEDILSHRRARDISKVARYSGISKYFGFAIPSHYSLQLPREFLLPPEKRDYRKIAEYKMLCDKFYHTPEVSFEQIRNSQIDHVFIIDVLSSTVTKRDARDYIAACSVF